MLDVLGLQAGRKISKLGVRNIGVKFLTASQRLHGKFAPRSKTLRVCKLILHLQQYSLKLLLILGTRVEVDR
jgi:hypothetical protein